MQHVQTQVDFLNLKRQYHSIKPEIDDAIAQVLENTAFSGGRFVDAFEKNFAALHQASYCSAVNNGTAALHVALMALNIGSGDEVIVPANTFFASAEAVSLTGATPVFTDCEPEFYNLDPVKLEQAITPRTKAVIAVHLYGQSANLAQIKTVTDKHGLLLIEDCAQAHTAEFQGQPVGTTGIVGCFSFYPGKNLGAYGEGGAIITNDKALFDKMQALKNHGSYQKYYHDYVGHNYRMEGFQGAILDVKLRYIQQWTEARRHHAALYRELLNNVDEISLPQEMNDVKHVYHLFVIQAEKRDELIQFLNANGIQTGIHYPVPCHLQKAYSSLDYKLGDLPIAEMMADCIVSLPMFPELQPEEIQAVCHQIKAFYAKH